MKPVFFNLIKVPSQADYHFFDVIFSDQYVLERRDSSTESNLNTLVDRQISKVENDFFGYLQRTRRERRRIPTTRLDSYFYLQFKDDSSDLDAVSREDDQSRSVSTSSAESGRYSKDTRATTTSASTSIKSVLSIMKNSPSNVPASPDNQRVEQANIFFERELAFNQLMVTRAELEEKKQRLEQAQEPELFREEHFERLHEYAHEQRRASKARNENLIRPLRVLLDNQNLQLNPGLKRKIQRLLELGLLDLETYTKYELLDRLEMCRLLEVQF